MSTPSSEANVAGDSGTADPVELSYSLTRLQRVLNPPERLFHSFFGATVLLLSCVAVFGAPLYLSIWLVLGMWLVVWLLVGRVLVSLCLSLFSSRYIDTLTIGDGYLCFGVDGTYSTYPFFKNLTVTEGLCGTMIIQDVRRANAIVLPREAIPFAELKQLIEKNRTEKRAEQPPSP